MNMEIEKGALDVESITLTKNSRGYTWKVKIISQDKHISEADIDRLEKLDEECKKRWSVIDNENS